MHAFEKHLHNSAFITIIVIEQQSVTTKQQEKNIFILKQLNTGSQYMYCKVFFMYYQNNV